ncbi:nicotinamide/nicotinic acid mononucleotide adenylyltransferase [Punica granatum]|uniref:Nicotinamide/nicotinic acid mononucleotide adenylyltransferase n=1 Tax=Punica granatum TaxID=22663 RepID=A0A6P8BY96_PUNGR|nr:nicotinamide/nicotinic acid mononucleotide adenylyltransferase [Punica granatum]XP_031376028.1 nicotinamide/nicotinic acid mononucleotide adenylyltransferase [Punica granatum]XP_031376029.1 nicotinamide/nicotinic acid mononucleotide adenylyltransferase [Punica granatum]XP_031376030.1 nicotinamide/nicotinic acid mononucleotide adenylyltransferase [Punica granatum]
MVDSWEASQSTYQQTLAVLCRIKNCLCKERLLSEDSLKLMLVCSSDVLQSFSIPGVWIPEQVNIEVVDELVSNQISSTRVRDCISRGLSIKYLTADEVIDYIRDNHLYLKSNEDKWEAACYAAQL